MGTKWNDAVVDFLRPKDLELDAVVPDTRWLPRKAKKAWRKMMGGRCLTWREWRTVDVLSTRQRKRVVYLRIPFKLRSVPFNRVDVLL